MPSDEEKVIDTKLASVLRVFATRLRAGEHDQELLDAVSMELEEKARDLEKAAT